MLMGVLTYYASLLVLRDDYIFTYTKILLIKTGHAFRYISRSVLSQSRTAIALLGVPSQTRNVKDAHLAIGNIKKKKKNE